MYRLVEKAMSGILGQFQKYLRKCDVNVVDAFFLKKFKSVNPYVKNR